MKERGGGPSANQEMPHCCVRLAMDPARSPNCAAAREIPLVLGDDTTFFEKREPNDLEQRIELGKPYNPAQRATVRDAQEIRRSITIPPQEQWPRSWASRSSGPGKVNDIGFIDEFHYDREGTRSLCDDFAKGLEKIL